MKRYVEIPLGKEAAARPAYDPVKVVWHIASIADAARSGKAASARALVMMQQRAAKTTLSALTQAGFTVIVPQTGDRRLDANPKAAERVSLGTHPARALFSNAFAVLEAARACMADVVFLLDDACALEADNRFLIRTKEAGLRVFRPAKDDSTSMLWVECEASDKLDQPTTWRTCHACKLTFDNAEFAREHLACPSCHTLARLGSAERIEATLDANSFEEWNAELPDTNPLDFPGYADKIAAQRAKSGLSEGVRTGRGRIGGIPVAVGFMEPSFLMGSMGSVVGQKVALLFDRATEEKLPVVMFCASGGARMQEGLVSLMQMAKTSCAVSRHDKAGLLYVSVLTDPTTGGVTASFATQGDIILAEPGALIGFAGQRVIRDTIGGELPEGFQTAEFALEHGLIDAIVERDQMRETLRRILALHAPRSARERSDAQMAEEKTNNRVIISQLVVRHQKSRHRAESLPLIGKLVLRRRAEQGDEDEVGQRPHHAADVQQKARVGIGARAREARQLERRTRKATHQVAPKGKEATSDAWESVKLARNVHRPTAQYYLKRLSPQFIELHGDRAFADDGAIIGGIGLVEGEPVTIIAQEKGATLPERIKRNFGCPMPEGYRKSARLMRQAEKFGRPVVCIVDTQGAFCGTEAEERGAGSAIAENLALLAQLRVPVVSLLVGEGGSGGALALALANRVAMQEHAVYSVLSPEGFASILWKDRALAPKAAELMRMSAQDAFELGLVEAVISEGDEPAHENPEQAAENACAYVTSALRELSSLSAEEIVRQRQERFARM